MNRYFIPNPNKSEETINNYVLFFRCFNNETFLTAQRFFYLIKFGLVIKKTKNCKG